MGREASGRCKGQGGQGAEAKIRALKMRPSVFVGCCVLSVMCTCACQTSAGLAASHCLGRCPRLNRPTAEHQSAPYRGPVGGASWATVQRLVGCCIQVQIFGVSDSIVTCQVAMSASRHSRLVGGLGAVLVAAAARSWACHESPLCAICDTEAGPKVPGAGSTS